VGTIVLQFVEGSGLGAGLIKWFGHGTYSHVDAVLPDGRLLGARSDNRSGVPEGVQIRPASYVGLEKTTRIVLPATDVQESDFYAFLHDQIGKPYNRIGIVAFALNAAWTSVGAWFCSHLQTAALQRAGWLPQLSEPPNKIDPDDLFLILSAIVNRCSASRISSRE
jgi:hypothetical protein